MFFGPSVATREGVLANKAIVMEPALQDSAIPSRERPLQNVKQEPTLVCLPGAVQGATGPGVISSSGLATRAARGQVCLAHHIVLHAYNRAWHTAGA